MSFAQSLVSILPEHYEYENVNEIPVNIRCSFSCESNNNNELSTLRLRWASTNSRAESNSYLASSNAAIAFSIFPSSMYSNAISTMAYGTKYSSSLISLFRLRTVWRHLGIKGKNTTSFSHGCHRTNRQSNWLHSLQRLQRTLHLTQTCAFEQ